MPRLALSLLLLPAVVPLAACGDSGSTCVVNGLDAGAGQASIDGTDWAATGAVWSVAGSGVQITTDAVEGWRLTMAVTTTIDGLSVAEALVDGASVQVSLGDEGSFAALYPTESSSSYAARDVGTGDVVLSRQGDQVSAC